VDPAELRGPWDEMVRQVLDRATLAVPEDGYVASGSREGIHTEHLGHLLAEMQVLPRSFPGARW